MADIRTYGSNPVAPEQAGRQHKRVQTWGGRATWPGNTKGDRPRRQPPSRKTLMLSSLVHRVIGGRLFRVKSSIQIRLSARRSSARRSRSADTDLLLMRRSRTLSRCHTSSTFGPGTARPIGTVAGTGNLACQSRTLSPCQTSSTSGPEGNHLEMERRPQIVQPVAPTTAETESANAQADGASRE
jgi:hypothetical protein